MTASTSPSHSDRVLPGVALMIGFCAVAPLIDVAAKIASQEVTVTQVVVLRVLVQTALMLPIVLIMRQSLRLTGRQLGWQALRAGFLIGSTYAFVGAVQVMPIADALAIAFVEPFVILALGSLLLGDQVGWRRITAALVGFGGAMLVIQPNFARFGVVALYPLGTALCFALYMLTTRHISRQFKPEAMQFHTAWVGSVLMVPILLLGWGGEIQTLSLRPAEPAVWGWLVGVGVAATVSHLMITYALRFAPSATLAPLHYLEIVAAVFFGWVFFADWPNTMSWAGITVIALSGLYVIARERQLARQARQSTR